MGGPVLEAELANCRSSAFQRIRALLSPISPQSETRFQAEHDVLVRACMRIFISLASVLYLFFVLWDVVQRDNSGLIKPVSINLGFVFVASVCYYMLFQQALFHGRRKSSCSCALLRAWG